MYAYFKIYSYGNTKRARLFTNLRSKEYSRTRTRSVRHKLGIYYTNAPLLKQTSLFDARVILQSLEIEPRLRHIALSPQTQTHMSDDGWYIIYFIYFIFIRQTMAFTGRKLLGNVFQCLLTNFQEFVVQQFWLTLITDKITNFLLSVKYFYWKKKAVVYTNGISVILNLHLTRISSNKLSTSWTIMISIFATIHNIWNPSQWPATINKRKMINKKNHLD